MKTKLDLFANVSAISTLLIKQWSHTVTFVFLKKLYNSSYSKIMHGNTW